MTTAIPVEERSNVLFAPQDYLSARMLTTLVVAQAVIGLLLSRFGIRFDGAMDVHRTWLGDATPVFLAVLDQFASLFVAAAGAYVVLRAWGQRPSFSAVVQIIGIARLPLVLIAPLVLLLPTPATFASAGFMPVGRSEDYVLSGVGALLGVAWMVVMLSTGIRRHVPQRGGKLAVVVLSVLVGAEVASKLFLAVAG